VAEEGIAVEIPLFDKKQPIRPLRKVVKDTVEVRWAGGWAGTVSRRTKYPNRESSLHVIAMQLQGLRK